MIDISININNIALDEKNLLEALIYENNQI